MTIKAQALVKTALFIGTMFLAAIGMSAMLEFFDPNPRDVMYTAMIILASAMSYFVYSYNVNEMEYRAKLEEMTESNTRILQTDLTTNLIRN